jgi:hypothetical protein
MLRVALLLFACALAFAAHATPPEDAHPAQAPALLERAFANRYDVELTSRIELVVRSADGQERRRTLQAMSKVIDRRMHSIGRLVEPEHLRGMTMLMVEAQDRSHDVFLYLPSLALVRRISTAQRGDAFFGTDVTYEDLERQRAQDFELRSVRTEEWEGEPVHRIDAVPKRAYQYARVRFTLAVADLSILRTEYFKRGADTPYRVIRAPRAAMIEQAGHVLPTRLVVESRDHGTTTEVRIENLRVDPRLDPRLFSVKTLQSQRPLPIH